MKPLLTLLLLPLAACSSAFSAPTGMHLVEVACDELGDAAYVEAVLVPDVGPQGWVAVVGLDEDGDWEEAEGVSVRDGDLRLDGACPPGESLRLSWW